MTTATPDQPTVSIVIPAWNKWEYTRRCLASLRAHTADVDHEVIVVDNGSTDATPEGLRDFPEVRVARNEANLGFARASNQGAALARGRYLLFLNNDTEAKKSWLRPMVALLDGDGSIGMVGAKLLFPDGTLQHAGVAVAYASPLPISPFHLDYRQPAGKSTRQLDLQVVTGACMLVRPEVFRAVGGFDEAYVNGYEDLDLCFKVREAGHRVVYTPASVLTHHESVSDGRFLQTRHNEDLLERAWMGRFTAFDVDRRRQPAPPPPDPGRPPLSVVVPVKDSLRTIAPCLEDLARNLGPSDRLLVTDAGSRDCTLQFVRLFAREHPGLVQILEGAPDLPAALRAGLERATGELAMVIQPVLRTRPGFADEILGALGQLDSSAAICIPLQRDGLCLAGESGLLRALTREAPHALFEQGVVDLEAAVRRHGRARLVIAEPSTTPATPPAPAPMQPARSAEVARREPRDVAGPTPVDPAGIGSETGERAPGRQESIRGVIFSKDRPMQLEATLRSLLATCQDPDRLSLKVVCRATSEAMRRRYGRVAATFPAVEIVEEAGFKETLLAAIDGAELILFVVDDAIFVRRWSAARIEALLAEDGEAIGFSLRLGRNTVRCYPVDRPQRLPAFQPRGDALALEWRGAELDFGYPLELSSSVYRHRDLGPLLARLDYRNPNELESALDAAKGELARLPLLLCPPLSAAFCVPLNVVQRAFPNRAGRSATHTPDRLAALFDAGARIDVRALEGYTPTACHEEVDLPLIGPAEVPRVSVVIPCYRQAEFLPFAVASVLSQGYQDWEIVIVNDGSPDETSRIARDLARANPSRRIRLIEQANGGLAAARNAGVGAARGDLILPLDADDGLAPSFLERTVAAIDASADASIAFTDATYFGAKTGIWRLGPFDLEHLKTQNRACCTSLFRRSVWEQTGGYNANMVLGYEDWDLWIGAAERGFKAVHVPEPLFLYRQRATSMVLRAHGHHRQLMARMVLNHPGAYSPEERARSAQLLEAAPLPPRPVDPSPRPPDAGSASMVARDGGAPPAVSVVIPCFGQAEYLPFAVSSVALQTFTDWEIVVVDDGSPDDTARVAEELISKLPGRRIRLLRRENGGPGAARNAGIATARGRYIVPLDADDALDPTFLEKTIGLLEANPGVSVVGTDGMTFGLKTTPLRAVPLASPQAVARANSLNYCSPYRREVWEACGGYDEARTLAGYEDWDFWVGAKERGFAFAHVAEPIFFYRVKEVSLYTKALKSDRHLRCRILLKHPSSFSEAERAAAQEFLRDAPAPAPALPPVASPGAGPPRPPGATPGAPHGVASSPGEDAERPQRNGGDVRDPAMEAWRAAGCPFPPPQELKAAAIRAQASRHGTRVFVETGTFRGDTLHAIRSHFDVLVSIELDPALHEAAARRFASDARIVCLRGDSGKVLPEVLDRIDAPALFWLDGHFSGPGTARGDRDTPIVDELRAILRHRVRRHVVLIDDARLFGVDPAYPSIREILDLVRAERPDCGVDVALDAIRVSPAAESAAVVATGDGSPLNGRRLPRLPSRPGDPGESLLLLRSAGLTRDGAPLRLHLGCGETRLDGYVNVDIPPTDVSLMKTVADVFGDVPTLRFPPGSVDEVRSHHVFEHFGRVEAMALLIRWHEWLRPGGSLLIETPDLVGSARMVLSDRPLALKMAAVRHLTGDQAEGWAYHVDQWFEDRFRETLSRLGFANFSASTSSWPHPPFLANVTASAQKVESLPRAELLRRGEALLAESAVAPSEARLVDLWGSQLRACLSDGQAPRRSAPALDPSSGAHSGAA